MGACTCMCVAQHMWRSENLLESLLSSRPVDPRTDLRPLSFGWCQVPLPPEHLISPWLDFNSVNSRPPYDCLSVISQNLLLLREHWPPNSKPLLKKAQIHLHLSQATWEKTGPEKDSLLRGRFEVEKYLHSLGDHTASPSECVVGGCWAGWRKQRGLWGGPRARCVDLDDEEEMGLGVSVYRKVLNYEDFKGPGKMVLWVRAFVYQAWWYNFVPWNPQKMSGEDWLFQVILQLCAHIVW